MTSANEKARVNQERALHDVRRRYARISTYPDSNAKMPTKFRTSPWALILITRLSLETAPSANEEPGTVVKQAGLKWRRYEDYRQRGLETLVPGLDEKTRLWEPGRGLYSDHIS